MTKLYTQDHEWVEVDGDIASIGVSAFAAAQLGEDIVAAEDMIPAGETVTKGDVLFVFEKAKAAVEVYAPVSGEVVAVNTFLEDDPSTFHDKLTSLEWLFQIRLSDASEADGLMVEADYAAFIEDEG